MLSAFFSTLEIYPIRILFKVGTYSYLSNNRGGWNKRGGGAKVAKSLNLEGGIFWTKLVHKCNKCGMEGGKRSKK